VRAVGIGEVHTGFMAIMTESEWREFGARNGVPGEYLVRVRMTKVIAEHALAS
jgi:hypothetical protein